MCDHNFFHLLNGNCALHVNPLVLNHVLLLELKHKVDAADVAVSDEAETTRFVRPLVLQDDAVLNLTKVLEVRFETG